MTFLYFPCNFLAFFLCVFYLILVSFSASHLFKDFFYYCRRSRAFICYLKMWEFIEAFLFLVYWLYLFLTFFPFSCILILKWEKVHVDTIFASFSERKTASYPLLKHLGTNEIIFLVLLLEVNFYVSLPAQLLVFRYCKSVSLR